MWGTRNRVDAVLTLGHPNSKKSVNIWISIVVTGIRSGQEWNRGLRCYRRPIALLCIAMGRPNEDKQRPGAEKSVAIFFKVTQRMTIWHSFVNKTSIPTGDWKYGRSQVRWGLEVESLIGNSEWVNHHCEKLWFSVNVLLTSLKFPGGILQWWRMWQITREI